MAETTTDRIRLYEGEGDRLVQGDRTSQSQRIILLPSGDPRTAPADRDRIRLQWGQHLLADVLAGRYRTVICGVNDRENASGILGELLALVPTSQWSVKTATSYAQMFQKSVAIHAADDREPYVLKFDLDRLLILALLRPAGRDHFTLEDLSRGFTTISKMLKDRHDRLPTATVSFLDAKSNRLVGEDGGEPSLEAVARTMFEAGFRGDLYPPLAAWELAPTACFASYPYPDSLDEMRRGGH